MPRLMPKGTNVCLPSPRREDETVNNLYDHHAIQELSLPFPARKAREDIIGTGKERAPSTPQSAHPPIEHTITIAESPRPGHILLCR
jgi:hypothetical protein